MRQIIDLSGCQTKKSSQQRILSTGVYNAPVAIDYSDEEYKLTLNILTLNNPNKISFVIAEVADQLNVSNEFIRRRIKSGLIAAKYFGDKPMIHITELARILTKGIK